LRYFWSSWWWTTSARILLANIPLEKEKSCQGFAEQSRTSKNAGPWYHLRDMLLGKILLKTVLGGIGVVLLTESQVNT